MDGREALPADTSFKDRVNRSCFEDSNCSDEASTEDHKEETSKTRRGLGRVFRRKIGIGCTKTDTHRDNPRYHKKNGGRREDHHEWGYMEKDVGGNDEYLRKKEKGDIVNEKLDPEKGF